MRSVNVITVSQALDATIGSAMVNISRIPPGAGEVLVLVESIVQVRRLSGNRSGDQFTPARQKSTGDIDGSLEWHRGC